MKKTVSFLLAAVMLLSFAACAKAPTEPVTTASQAYTVVNPVGQSSASDEGESNVVYSLTESNVDFVTQSYYTYATNYASIENINIDTGAFSANVNGYLDLKMIKIGSRGSDMLIGVKAYDKNGKLVRDTFIKADLKGVWSGRTVKDVRFDVPYEAVKVEFYDYVEN